MTEQEQRDIGLAREFLRKRRGLTQQGLADKAGLAVNVVRRAENCQPVSDHELRALASALDEEFATYADGRLQVAVPEAG